MKYKIFAVHDIKAEAFMSPFFMNTKAQAKRSFMDAMQNPEMPFGRHPQDYTLFCIGTFTDHDGVVSGEEKESLGNGVEFKALIEKNQQPELELESVN